MNESPDSIQLMQTAGTTENEDMLNYHYDHRFKWNNGIFTVSFDSNPTNDNTKSKLYTVCLKKKNTDEVYTKNGTSGSAYIIYSHFQGAITSTYSVCHEAGSIDNPRKICKCCYQHAVQIYRPRSAITLRSINLDTMRIPSGRVHEIYQSEKGKIEFKCVCHGNLSYVWKRSLDLTLHEFYYLTNILCITIPTKFRSNKNEIHNLIQDNANILIVVLGTDEKSILQALEKISNCNSNHLLKCLDAYYNTLDTRNSKFLTQLKEKKELVSTFFKCKQGKNVDGKQSTLIFVAHEIESWKNSSSSMLCKISNFMQKDKHKYENVLVNKHELEVQLNRKKLRIMKMDKDTFQKEFDKILQGIKKCAYNNHFA